MVGVVQARYLNGEEVKLSNISCLDDIRIAIADRQNCFVMEITLVDSQHGTVLLSGRRIGMQYGEPNASPPPPTAVHIVVHPWEDTLERWNIGLLEHAYSGDTIGVQRAIAKGAFVDTADEQNQRTALHLSSYRGHTKIVHLLFLAGANVDARDVLANTPLSDAVKCGRTEVVKFLLSAGANVHSIDWVYSSVQIDTRREYNEVAEIIGEHQKNSRNV